MDNNDSVKVVRCKNCKFCEIYMRYGKPIDDISVATSFSVIIS